MDIQIDDEIITYGGISTTAPYGFTDCIRGLHKTVATNHNAGAMIHHLQKRYGGYTLDAETTLLDEVSQRIAEVMNACGFDMIYLDNSEHVQSPPWYYKTKVQMANNRLNRQDVLVQGKEGEVSKWNFQVSQQF